jgi:HEAT repeat protein
VVAKGTRRRTETPGGAGRHPPIVGPVTEAQLVQALADKTTRLAAMRALVGGVTATELTSVEVSETVLQALTDGVSDADPRVRWWSIQLLDHVADPRAVEAIIPALHDPVPRVRRNAAHALGCASCKPAWDGRLPPDAHATLTTLAASDPNAKVRREAQLALACRAVLA